MSDWEMESGIFGPPDPTEAEMEALRLASAPATCPVCGFPPESFKCVSFRAKGLNGHSAGDEISVAQETRPKTLSEMNHDELVALADERGVDVTGLKNNHAIRVALGMRLRKD